MSKALEDMNSISDLGEVVKSFEFDGWDDLIARLDTEIFISSIKG